MSWVEDEDGKEHPVLNTTAGGPSTSEATKSLPLAAKPRYSMAYVKEQSKTLLRQVTQLTQQMPPLPPTHYLSMRVIYRDDKTPPSYEPTGLSLKAATR